MSGTGRVKAVSRSAIIFRNVASTWIGFAVNAAVTVVLTPFILHQLGATRYGIWILTSSLIGYYGLLDFGFRAGVTQYLTRYLAMGDYRRASECMSSAVAALAALGAVMCGLSFGAAYLAPRLFDLHGVAAHEAFWTILIVGCSSGVQFAFSPYTSIFTATQRFDLATVTGIVTRLLTAASIVVALKAGYGLIGLSAVTCAMSLVDYGIRCRMARYLVPQLQLSPRLANMSRLREISAFGAWNFLMSINTFVYQHVPNILIGAHLPIAAVGHYALATGLTRHINAVLSPAPRVVFPAATEMHVKGDERGLERLYYDGTRMTLLVMTTVVLVAAFWASDFYRIWIGNKYLTGVPFHSVAVLFQILLLSVATSYSASIANQILVSAGRVRVVALALVCGSFLNLGISLLLIRSYGLAGVAIATVSASLIIDLIVMHVLVQRTLNLRLDAFLRRACGRPFAAAALQATMLAAVRVLLGRPDNWPALLAQGVVAGVISAAVVLAIGVTPEERQRFVFRPVRRVWRGTAKPAEASLS